MRVTLTNLGVLRHASFELGEMTIICGENNTGKTYATYALYNFIDFWRNAFSLKIDPMIISNLLSSGSVLIDLNSYLERSKELLNRASAEYSKVVHRGFASKDKNFINTEFKVEVSTNAIDKGNYELVYGSVEKNIINIRKDSNNKLEVSFVIDKSSQNDLPSRHVILDMINFAIKDILFSNELPNTFIASAERTGTAIFRKELDFARNRLIELLGEKEEEITPNKFLRKYYSDYAKPVRDNVDFSRKLESVSKNESFLMEHYPSLLDDFSDLIGGEYRVSKDDLYYIPNNSRHVKLTMAESSSSVRSLLDISFYLHYLAKPGYLLMVDEPELNLHPENQRRIARLFTRLINAGIKIFITTHSDYIIKEINTLIMLNKDEERIKNIQKKYGYMPEELIKAENVKVYIAKKSPILIEGNARKTSVFTLIPANIGNEYGIEAESFDKSIDEMNSIQDEIIFGGE